MRDFVHDWWPVAAVTLFTAMRVLQLPRKAIFPPTPTESAVEPFASFVELDDAAYAAVLRRVRMSWEMRARMQLSGGESRTAAFDFDEPAPPPLSLGGGAEFSTDYRAPCPAPPVPAPLLPPTLAQSGVEGLAKAVSVATSASTRDADMLAIPDSLSETPKEQKQ